MHGVLFNGRFLSLCLLSKVDERECISVVMAAGRCNDERWTGWDEMGQ